MKKDIAVVIGLTAFGLTMFYGAIEIVYLLITR